MLHQLAARVHSRAVIGREVWRKRLARRHEDDGLESIEVVVLSVVALGIVIALGAAIKALVLKYQAQLG